MFRSSSAGVLRRFLALGAAIAIAGSLLAAPAAAAAPTARPGGGWGDHAGTRSPVAAARITGREAARRSATTHRHAAVAAPRPRPERFGGRSAAPGAPVVASSEKTAPAPKVALPGELLSTREMAGIDHGLAGSEPPDPWIAVSTSYLVQSVNGVVRISDRSGRALLDMATWALFSIPAGYADSDPRILWDATHGRWVGVLVAYDASFSDTFLSVIVSDGADPRGGWNVYQYAYGPDLPDYPGLASSSDKIVVTANEYENGDTYLGSSFLVLPWSSVLAGTDVTGRYDINANAWNLRPGRLVSAAADLHFVYEGGDGDLRYLQLTGSPTAYAVVDASLGLPAGTYTLPAPRQPGDADGIADADDGRIPDAVWRSGHLWFARTIAGTWDGGSTTDLVVEVTRVDTVSGGAPTLAGDAQSDHGVLGSDAFTPGIGMSGDGSVFLEYSRSSDATPPSIVAEAWQAAYGWFDPVVIEDSDANHDGDRWGDFVGIAADPAGSATAWQSNQVAAADGTWRTVVSRLVLDFADPTATAPNQSLVTGSRLGSTVPVRVSWTGADAGSGVTLYWLQAAELGDPTFSTLAGTPATSLVRAEYWKSSSSSADLRYQYRVIAVDDAGNDGAAATGSALAPTVYQQSSVTFSSGWKKATSRAYSGGIAKYSSTKGASATFKASGRSFGFVSYRSPTRGKVKVYVDGKYKGTLRLTSPTTKSRNLAYVISFASSGSHTIRLVVAKGRVDVDAFVVLR